MTLEEYQVMKLVIKDRRYRHGASLLNFEVRTKTPRYMFFHEYTQGFLRYYYFDPRRLSDNIFGEHGIIHEKKDIGVLNSDIFLYIINDCYPDLKTCPRNGIVFI